ncbi:transglutaminase-like cysteine peptidase [Arvimicrobium flavum]|uniref:transglutaminase-like cysteine peptidase n=1 Tax=Arvimicrobium flavum TaxID=3393320 RepID=UPI00237A8FDA|nr:transglutaminase-like cysteine peptidase [Mesorhizobium shangrilense]
MISSLKRRCAQIVIGVALIAAATTATSAGAGSMVVGGLTSQPIGHYEFCREAPEECAVKPRDQRPLQLTEVIWEQIVSINEAVNQAVEAMNDFDIYGKDEVWAYPDGVGDCEDYALEKRRELSERGISLSNLLLTVVRKSDGEGHAVLTVRTDKGDFILDNLNTKVLQWDRTDYRYLKRQASENTGRWVSIQDGSQTLVGSVSH